VTVFSTCRPYHGSTRPTSQEPQLTVYHLRWHSGLWIPICAEEGVAASLSTATGTKVESAARILRHASKLTVWNHPCEYMYTSALKLLGPPVDADKRAVTILYTARGTRGGASVQFLESNISRPTNPVSIFTDCLCTYLCKSPRCDCSFHRRSN
jgi:hypothetical protein